MNSEENNIKNIFIKYKNKQDKTTNILNTAQTLYINEFNNQKGGKKKIDNSSELSDSDMSDDENNEEYDEEIDEDNNENKDDNKNDNEDEYDEYKDDDEDKDDDDDDIEDENDNDDNDDNDDIEDDDIEKNIDEDDEFNIDDCIYNYDDMIDDKYLDKKPVEVLKEDRITDPQMTYYEKIRIIGIRSKQIAMGSKVMVKYDNDIGAVELAKYELENKTTPLIIKRLLPDNTYELWKINELKIDNDNELDILENIKKKFKENDYNFI